MSGVPGQTPIGGDPEMTEPASPQILSQLPPANCYPKIRDQRWKRSACPRQNHADACRPSGPAGDHAGYLSGLGPTVRCTRSGSDHSTSLVNQVMETTNELA